MSQVGGFIERSDLPPGGEFSWALMAVSAITNGSSDTGCGAGGIMAASPDVGEVIMSGSIDQLFIWPDNMPPGLYLWYGRLEEDGACIGHGERLHPDCMQHWIDLNGQMA